MSADHSARDFLAELAYFRTALRELASEVHGNPEIGLHEFHAVLLQKQLLERYGFDVVMPYCGLETAFRAEYGSAESPSFAFASEYDALPELGHACGHNLICCASLGAFLVVARRLRLDNIPARILLLGTPAEESVGGKALMLDHDCLKGVDACMMVHPGPFTEPDTGSSSLRSFAVTFRGRAAHAAAAPEKGINALDAALLLFHGISLWRQALPESARIHGVISEGGTVPNIIPDKTVCRVYLRASDENLTDRMEERFFDMVRGAELFTGVSAEIRREERDMCARLPNPVLNRIFLRAAEEAGLSPIIPAGSSRDSSDFGNFSRIVPGIHPYFSISETPVAGHTVEMRDAAGSDFGFEQAMKAAAAMAFTAWHFLTSSAVREEVRHVFDEGISGMKKSDQ